MPDVEVQTVVGDQVSVAMVNASVSVDASARESVDVAIGEVNVNVSLGDVLPVYQQKETYVPQTFTATQGQTVFALSTIPRANSVQAFKNGVLLGPDEYVVAGSTLTTNEGLDAGDILDTHFTVA